MFDISYVIRKWQSDHLNDKENVILVFLVEAFLLFLTSFFVGESLPSFAAFSIPTIAVLIIASLANVANLFLVNYGFGRVEAHIAGNVLALEMAFALVFGILIYQEIPILRELLGGALIVYSVYRMNKLVT